MPRIIPIPTTRVSDSFVRQRLLTQIQSDQLDLFKIQNSISTGRRINLPSDDAPAALRAISLQSLLERKQQAQVNLQTNQSYLGATDTAIAGVSSLLASIRGTALGVSDSTSTDEQRNAAALEVSRALEQLVDIGNHQFRGRYLFAGSSTTVQPFTSTKGTVEYHGNQKSLLSFSDVDLLFETNMPGDAVFGAISEPVRGSIDLNPVLTDATAVSNLRGGKGISAGSVAISDGLNTSIVDVSGAATIGDVARLLETHPPAGRTVTARVTATGLTVELDAGGSGNLTIKEVGGGTTAGELGILNTLGGSTGPIVGRDLDPRLNLTTSLSDILGVRARAYSQPLGSANNLVFEAAVPGPEFNGVTINYVDDAKLQAAPGLGAGNEVAVFSPTAVAARASLALPGPTNDLILTAAQAGAAFNGVKIDIVNDGNIGDVANVTYNAGTKTLRIGIDDSDETTIDMLVAAVITEGTFTAARDASAEINAVGGVVPTIAVGANVANTRNSGGDANTLFVRIQSGFSTANQVLAAVNAEGTFTARLDRSEGANGGGGAILDSFADPAGIAVSAGGSGIVFDKDSGLRVTNGGKTSTIDFATANTIEDLLNTLNGAGIGLLAEINESGTGIDVRSRDSGSDFSLGENGGATATELGIRSLTAQTPLAELNHGRGVNVVNGNDFLIHRKDGVEFEIDVSGALTIGEVLDRINNNATNLAGPVPVVARLAAFGNGIELVDDDLLGADPLSIKPLHFSEAALDLGLIPVGAAASAPATPGVAATGTLTVPGPNNDLVFTAKGTGTEVNGVQVLFVDSGLGAGNETVAYNTGANTLTFDIDLASTTANRAIGVLQANPLANTYFSGSLVAADGAPNSGGGLLDLSAAATIDGGVAETLTGKDTDPAEVRGVFTALARLRDALKNNDLREISRAIEILDDGATALNFSRAELGARQQSLDVLQDRIESETIDLKSALSLEIDADLATTISELTARQAAFEASLRTAAQISRLSLLDFL